MAYEYLKGFDLVHYSAFEVMAYVFAKKAHELVGQVRKGSGLPYIVHPSAVAYEAKLLGMNETAVAVAFVHDVAEETEYGLKDIERVLGKEVADGVSYLTEIAKLPGQNRAQRLNLYGNQLARAPGWVQTIKVLDMSDNLSDVTKVLPDFAPKYLSEKKEQLKFLDKADPVAVERLKRIMDEQWGIIGMEKV